MRIFIAICAAAFLLSACVNPRNPPAYGCIDCGTKRTDGNPNSNGGGN